MQALFVIVTKYIVNNQTLINLLASKGELLKFSPLRFRRDTPPGLLLRSDRRAAPLVLNLSPGRAGQPFFPLPTPLRF